MSADAKFAMTGDSDDDGEVLSYAERGQAEELNEALEQSGGESALPTFPPKSSASLMAEKRRYLFVALPVLAILLVFVLTRVFGGAKHAKTGPPPVLGVAKNTSAPNRDTAKPHSNLAPVYSVPYHTVKVVAKHPHDPTAFTQGLEYARGYLWESTGLRGHSSLRRVRLSDGAIEQEYKFADRHIFGEGMTLHHDHHIFMLSWQAGRGFIFDQNTFKLLKEWHYKGEGWGLAMHDSAEEVWMSDGTSALRVLEPKNLNEVRRVHVTLDGKRVSMLNEIEWVCGEIWANVWQTKLIYRIDPRTGAVKSIVNCESLPLPQDVVVGQNVLNGIAYDWRSGRLWLTGKKWAKIYQVHVNDPHLDLTHCKP